MIDGCPMTEDCPGYDPEGQVCLVRPGDCEFAPADPDAVAASETLPTPASAPLPTATLEAAKEAGSR